MTPCRRAARVHCGPRRQGSLITPTDPLSIARERMRELGYRTIDFLVERMHGGTPGIVNAAPDDWPDRLAHLPTDSGQAFEDILAEVDELVIHQYARIDHPGFFAFIPGAGTWPGALADLIASALNIHVSDWMESPGPSRLELAVLGWFKDWAGYPVEAGGLLVSGGSVANLTALACAAERVSVGSRGDAVVYLSDQAHSSMGRAARVLGFGADRIRVLPTDDAFRLSPAAVAAAIDEDAGAGRRPLFLCASAGTTNTGAVDPLGELAEVCHERGVWLHVDGAYGGFAVLTPRGRELLEGLDRADSVTLDPHKWLAQPFECGCLLVRDGSVLHRTFRTAADYLRDTELGEPNFQDIGIQLTRAFRALKVWMSFRFFGLDAFRSAIQDSLELAGSAADSIEATPELELLVPPQLSILCLRRHPAGVDDEGELEQINARLVSALARSGEGLVSSTRVDGRYAIRMCVLNHTTGAEDVQHVLRFLAEQPTPG